MLAFDPRGVIGTIEIMRGGKYTRLDGRRPSNYCSTVSIVVFVALGLVGIWMMTSSSSTVPVQTIPSGDKNNEVREQVSEDNGDKLKQYEDNAGDLTQAEGKSYDKEIPKSTKTSTEDVTEEDQERKPVKESVNEENKSQGESTTEKENIKTGSNDEDTYETKGNAKSDGQADSKEGSRSNDSDSNEDEKKSDSDENEKKSDSDEFEKKSDTGDSENNKSDLDENVKESEEKSGEAKEEDKVDGQVEKEQQDQDESKQTSGESKEDDEAKKQAPIEVFPSGAQSELSKESTIQNGSSWLTQAAESRNEKEAQQAESKQQGYTWKLCNVTAGPDYIPCLDNLQAIKKLRSTKHYEHRERHCPEVAPTCLVPLPEGYKRPIPWPTSRDKIWYSNVPHTRLAEYKGHQNWVKVTGEYLTFPGGGTQFKHGALHYIEFIEQTVPDIAWGKRTRVVLDVGCGVASFGGYLFEKDVITMSLAPKDEHEAQVQFALERGIPAISAVMGTKRLPFPGMVFDVVHCARCRVPWHIEGGKLLLELNRVLRPGGYFVWSATPVYSKKDPEDVEIWKAMGKLTNSMCWELVAIDKDKLNSVGAAIYRKPTSNECYERRSRSEPPICQGSDDPNAAWNVSLQSCMHKVPTDSSERGSQWPAQWPTRLQNPPYWLSSQVGVYGKAASEDFVSDYAHWKRVVNKSYLNGLGIRWSNVRNVMDMGAVYGGFAASLRDLGVWVMNVVSIDSPDTLPLIYERGLFGMYHNWCESFSTYPRTYDLLHADHLFSKIKKKCNLVALVAEVDRILRPEGKLIVRDTVDIISELENLLKAMQWEIRLTYSKDKEGILCAQKTMWRPTEVETIVAAIS